MTPWAGKPSRPDPAEEPAAAAIPNAGNPSLGLEAFLRRWEMNDFLFAIVMENIRTPDTRQPPLDAWFAVVPEATRDRLVTSVAARFHVDRWEAAFLVARTMTAAIVVVLAGWLAWRATRRPDTASWLEYAFLTVAWFWLLSPTQNPWYWTWALPLLVFARSRVWLALAGLLPLYYLRFWFIYHYPDAPVLDGLPHHGAAFFDLIVTWVEFAPWFFCLSVSAELAARRRRAKHDRREP
jgi:hypothetical protein